MKKLDDILGTEQTLDKAAAEGIATAIIHESHLKVLRWRIEWKSRSCASALMDAKRVDYEGVQLRGKVYDDAYIVSHVDLNLATRRPPSCHL
jgi:hypothetical protein